MFVRMNAFLYIELWVLWEMQTNCCSFITTLPLRTVLPQFEKGVLSQGELLLFIALYACIVHPCMPLSCCMFVCMWRL